MRHGFSSGIELRGATPVVGNGDVVVVASIRDERLRLPWFLHHHRQLGVRSFFMIDNGSSDGTAEYLSEQPDVAMFFAEGSYSASKCGVTWVNDVLGRYAVGHWALVLDADELLVYPNYETLKLPELTRLLERSGSDAMVAPLLDMYGRGPIRDVQYEAGNSLLEACPFFDPTGYDTSRVSESGPRVIQRGGPRHRLFWHERDREHPAPVLRKIPLVKWRRGLEFEASTHVLAGAKVAGVTGALLHFKLLQDFAGRAAKEATRKEHFADARQYAAYSDIASNSPELSAYHSKSVRFRDSQQLVSLGLMSWPENLPPRAGDTVDLAPRGTKVVDVGAVENVGSTILEERKTVNSSEPKPQYWKDLTVVDEEQRDLGGNLHHGDTHSVTPRLWRFMVERFAVRSLLDVGAGEGHALSFFHRLGVIAHGFDGLRRNVHNAKFPIALHDLTQGPYLYPCDMTYCVEVAEHIDKEHVGSLLETLCNAPVIVMTHGLPGQRGHHHVNNQEQSYWVQRLERRGYRLSADVEYFRQIAREEDSGSYFAESGLVFLKVARSAS